MLVKLSNKTIELVFVILKIMI